MKRELEWDEKSSKKRNSTGTKVRVDDKGKLKALRSKKKILLTKKKKGNIAISEAERKRQRVLEKIEELNDKYRQNIVTHENFGSVVQLANLNSLYSNNKTEEENEMITYNVEIEDEERNNLNFYANTIIYWFRYWLRRKEKRY